MTVAGDLNKRVSFSKKEVISDDSPPLPDYGNTEEDFVVQFTVAARIRPRLGGEAVQAARLEGRNFVNITIRASAQSRLITTDWIATDTRSGEVFNIRSVIEPPQDIEFLELLCERGVVS